MSRDTPLLSNLNILENISLIEEARYGIKSHEALANAKETLRCAECFEIALKRPSSASAYELYCAQLCRASLLDGKKILIVTPFMPV